MGVGGGLYMYDVVVKKFTFAISSPDEFLVLLHDMTIYNHANLILDFTNSRSKQNLAWESIPTVYAYAKFHPDRFILSPLRGKKS